MKHWRPLWGLRLPAPPAEELPLEQVKHWRPLWGLRPPAPPAEELPLEQVKHWRPLWGLRPPAPPAEELPLEQVKRRRPLWGLRPPAPPAEELPLLTVYVTEGGSASVVLPVHITSFCVPKKESFQGYIGRITGVCSQVRRHDPFSIIKNSGHTEIHTTKVCMLLVLIVG